MTVLERAPFLAILAALTVAMGAGERVGPAAFSILALFVASGVLLCSFQQNIRGQRALFAAMLFLTLLASLRIAHVLHRPLLPPLYVRGEGTVTEVRPWGRTYVAVLETREGRFLLRLPFATVTEGTRLAVEGVSRPLRRSGRGGFDEERFWRGYGVAAWLSPSKLEPTPRQPWNLHRLRYAVSRLLSIHLPKLTGAYLRAAWTGHRDESLNAAHRAWGTSHLLAVSGFHVGVVVLCAAPLLRRGRARVPLLSLLLWGYVLLTGAAPSALRAGVMIQSALLAELLGRPRCPVNSVAVAAVGLLLYAPFLFWNIGWRLSVLAALLIAAMNEEGSLKGTRFWLALSPTIWLVSFPQAAHTFGSVPLAGLPLNFFASAFFAAAFSMASAAAFLYLAGMPLTSWLLDAAEGGFFLWGCLADGIVALFPWSIAWGPFMSWCGAGLLFLWLCRAMRFPWIKTVLIAGAGALASFLLFL